MKNLSVKRYPSARLGRLLRCVEGGWWQALNLCDGIPAGTINEPVSQSFCQGYRGAFLPVRRWLVLVLPSADGKVGSDDDSPYSD